MPVIKWAKDAVTALLSTQQRRAPSSDKPLRHGRTAPRNRLQDDAGSAQLLERFRLYEYPLDYEAP